MEQESRLETARRLGHLAGINAWYMSEEEIQEAVLALCRRCPAAYSTDREILALIRFLGCENPFPKMLG